jgi:phosphate/sulfate permease
MNPQVAHRLFLSTQAPINQKQSDKAIPLEDLTVEKSTEYAGEGEAPLDKGKEDSAESDDENPTLQTTKRSDSEDNLLEDVEEGESLENAHERHKARNLFFHVQLFSASLGAFAHGANDTASTHYYSRVMIVPFSHRKLLLFVCRCHVLASTRRFR